MMLFDLAADRGEAHDVAKQHPEMVKQLLARFRKLEAQVPEFATPKNEYLFKRPAKGRPRTLMRLIGGELRYDRVPASQRHLLAD